MLLTVEPRSNWRECCLSITYKKSHVHWPGRDTGLRGWRSATNRLSHCTALKKTPSGHYKNKNFKTIFFFRFLKFKFILWHATKAQRWLDVQLCPFLIICIRWGFVVKATKMPFYPEKEIRCPIYRGLGGSRCRFGRVLKNSVPSGFELRNPQHVTSHQTDYFIPAAQWEIYERLEIIFNFLLFPQVLMSHLLSDASKLRNATCYESV